MAEIPTPTMGYAAPARSRPLGVTILAILLILGAVFNLATIPTGLAFYPLYYIAYTALISIINLIIGIALFQLISWARMAAIIMQVLGLLLSAVMTVAVMGIMGGMFFSFVLISMLPSIIISLIVIIYLMQGSVKAAFEGNQW